MSEWPKVGRTAMRRDCSRARGRFICSNPNGFQGNRQSVGLTREFVRIREVGREIAAQEVSCRLCD